MKITPRMRRWLIISTSAVVTYATIGFFVVPPVARAQLEKRATAALHRAVKVAKVRFNPFAMSVTIEGLQVTDHDGAELASWARADANFDPLVSLFRWEWRLAEVRLTEPRQRLLIAKDGTLNIADLLATGSAPEPVTAHDTVLPAVGIDRLRVEHWSVDLTDQSRRSPFHTVVGPMTFELRDFSTRPGTAGTYVFAGASETIERFAWSGTISAAPAGSKGRIEFQNISLPQHMPLLEERFGGTITRGRVSIIVNYAIAAGNAPMACLENTSITIDDLGLGFRSATESAVAWKQLEVQLAKADLLARTADIARVTLTGLDAHAQRLTNGDIDLLDWLPPPAPPHPTADPGPAASVRVAELALIDARVRVTDHTTPRPGTIALDRINITATNAGTDLDREIKLDAQARWDGSGALTVAGTVRARPFAASLDLQGADLNLRSLDAWIEPAANIRIAAGVEHFRGHVDVAQEPGGKLALTWAGDGRIDGLAIHDGPTGAELLSWDALTYTDTRFNLDPLELSVGEIVLAAPTARVVIDEYGALNLTSLLTAAPGSAADTAPPASTAHATEKTSEMLAAATRQALPFAAKIGAITIAAGRLSLTDRSVPGGFITELRDFGGSIRGLSSAELARADADFSGSLDGVAPLRIKGSINPLSNDRFSDVTVSLSNIDLPLFTPYGGKFLGKKIQKGKLSVDLAYKLSQNQLAAENHVVFDQFYLGESVASPDTLKLPISLALALLRDREGKINLDLPVRGNLDDPDFKYGRMVWQVIGNVITKAATAPFALLGGLFGGKEQDLSYVDYNSGSFDLNEDATGKLAVLAKALFERPALRLEISSPPAPAGDRPGLREQRLAALLRAEKQSLAAASATLPPAEGAIAAPTSEETGSLIRSLFARQFPAEAAAAMVTEGSLPPPVPSVEETKKRGLLQRVVGSVFGRGAATTPPAPTAAPASEPAAQTPPPLTLANMQARLLETIVLTDTDFQDLASKRARVIRDRLLAGGTVEPERVFLVTEPKVPEGANSAIEGGRVFFGLE